LGGGFSSSPEKGARALRGEGEGHEEVSFLQVGVTLRVQFERSDAIGWWWMARILVGERVRKSPSTRVERERGPSGAPIAG